MTKEEVEKFKAMWKSGKIETMPLAMMDNEAHWGRDWYNDTVDSISFAMNTQQKFWRPTKLKVMDANELYAEWKKRRDIAFQDMVFRDPAIRYVWETDEDWLKRTGGFAVDKDPPKP